MSEAQPAKIRLYVEADLGSGVDLALGARQSHYLATVMRRRPGDAVLLFNGRDGEWRATILDAGRKACRLKIEDRTRPQTTEPDLWLLFAPIKRARLDYTVEKATELGTRVIWPVFTDFTNVDRVNLDRLQANVTEAAEQCRRLTVPEIRPPAKSLDEALGGLPSPCRRLVFDNGEGAALGGVRSCEPLAEKCPDRHRRRPRGRLQRAGARGLEWRPRHPSCEPRSPHPQGGYRRRRGPRALAGAARRLDLTLASHDDFACADTADRLLARFGAARGSSSAGGESICRRKLPRRRPSALRSRASTTSSPISKPAAVPSEDWRIGTEHEKFGYRLKDLGRLTYEGPQGIRAVLEGLQRFGWKPIYENGNLIALHMDGQSVTLEPGGQLELSGAPLAHRPPDLQRSLDPSGAGARNREGARYRLHRPRLRAEGDARRNAGHAQGPLQDHERLYGQEGHARPGHDVPHLHGPGESGLLVRSRHGQEVPHLHGACSRWRRRCSPTRPSPRASQTAI